MRISAKILLTFVAIFATLVLFGCIQTGNEGSTTASTTTTTSQTPTTTTTSTTSLSEKTTTTLLSTSTTETTKSTEDQKNTLESRYPDILATVNQTESEIKQATETMSNRRNTVTLTGCSNNVCLLNNLEIPDEDAHLDCGGKTLTPTDNTAPGLVITADGVSVVNCHFESFANAIIVKGSNTILFNNTIVGSSNAGIVLEGNSNKVFNNNIKNNKWAGVDIKTKSRRNIIYNNSMISEEGLYQPYANSFAAIGISGSDNRMINNVIKNNHEIGIKIAVLSTSDLPPQRNLIAYNTIDNNAVLGIEIVGAVEEDKLDIPATTVNQDHNIIFGNTISRSKLEFGLRIRWSDSNKVIGNKIYDNNWQGMHIQLSNGNLIEKNSIYANGKEGIWVGNARNNEISFNTISNNTEHCGLVFTKWNDAVSTNNSVKDNLFAGNGGVHDSKQICDEDKNLIYENEFK